VLDNLRLRLNVFTTRDITLARRLVAEKTAMREGRGQGSRQPLRAPAPRAGWNRSRSPARSIYDVIRDLKRINGHLALGGLSDLEAAGELADHASQTTQPLMRAPAES